MLPSRLVGGRSVGGSGCNSGGISEIEPVTLHDFLRSSTTWHTNRERATLSCGQFYMSSKKKILVVGSIGVGVGVRGQAILYKSRVGTFV